MDTVFQLFGGLMAVLCCLTGGCGFAAVAWWCADDFPMKGQVIGQVVTIAIMGSASLGCFYAVYMIFTV